MLNVYQPLYNEFGEEQVHTARRELTAKSKRPPSYIELLAKLYIKQESQTCTCTHDARTGESASICSKHGTE